MPRFLRPLHPRDAADSHRAATPLELLFDLVSVIAIASAALGLHHAVAEAHAAEGIPRFLLAFFAIWWAWMNYTWFASAYDNDDTLFRLLTMVIMAGALTMAAGVGALFKSFDLTLVVIGFVIMRAGMVALWLRAAYHDPARRRTALTYAAGIALVQVYWIGLALLVPQSHLLGYGLYALGAALELAVPVIAERQRKTCWHRHHIVERYGLLNIIVLGETLLAGAIALRSLESAASALALVDIAVSALVIVFAMWWLYFAREPQLDSDDLPRALVWGYGHFVIFASGAAVGAGFAVMVDIGSGAAKLSPVVGHYAVAVPVALYLAGLWFVRDRFRFSGPARYALPAATVLVLFAPLLPFAIETIAGLIVLCTAMRAYLAPRG